MTLNRLISCVLLLFLASAPTLNLHAEEDAALVQKGKELFSKNACNSCHAANMKTKLTGPALAGVEERWDNKADLYAWIRNSTAMIEAGHPRAVALWNEYKVKMNLYPNLTDEEIDALLREIRRAEVGREQHGAEAAHRADEGVARGERRLAARPRPVRVRRVPELAEPAHDAGETEGVGARRALGREIDLCAHVAMPFSSNRPSKSAVDR